MDKLIRRQIAGYVFHLYEKWDTRQQANYRANTYRQQGLYTRVIKLAFTWGVFVAPVIKLAPNYSKIKGG